MAIDPFAGGPAPQSSLRCRRMDPDCAEQSGSRFMFPAGSRLTDNVDAHRLRFDVRIEEERLQEMTGRPLTIAEINDRIAAIRDNLRELIEQAAANSGAADEDLSSNRIARQEAELCELMRLRDQLSAAAHGPAVDNFR